MKSANLKKREIQAKYRKLINIGNKKNKNHKHIETIAVIFSFLFLIIMFLNAFIKAF